MHSLSLLQLLKREMSVVTADYLFHSDYLHFTCRTRCPHGVTVQAQSCVTLNVTWSSPDHTGGLPITGYNISYTDGITNYVQGTFAEQMALIQHCSPGTTYKVKVVAFNVIGQGEETTMTTVRTNHRGIQLQIRQLHCARVQYIKQLDYAPFKISITYYICRVVSTYVPVLQ